MLNTGSSLERPCMTTLSDSTFALPLARPALPILSARWFTHIALGLLLVTSIATVVLSIQNWSDMDPAAGAWITLADDLARDGTFYRPLVLEDGTGGTRYMPLSFVIHAFVVTLGFPLIASGFALSILWGIALLAGAWRLLRLLNVPRNDAIIGTVLLLGAGCVQSAISSVKGDLAAAALNVWALVAFVVWWKSQRRGAWPTLAAMFFALAFMTKITSVFGCAAGCVVLLLDHRWRDAFKLASLTVLFALIGVAIVQFASDGRFIESLLACGGARGSMRFLAMAPVRFFEHLSAYDTAAMVAMMVAFGALLLARRYYDWRAQPLPIVALVMTVLATIAIYGSPGTARNHLIDLYTIAIIASTFAVSRCKSRPEIRIGMPGAQALGAAMITTSMLWQVWHQYDGKSMQAAFASVANVSGPILSEQPIIPLLRDERPYCMDWFSYETFTTRDPQLAARLHRDVASQRFGAIVFHKKITSDGKIDIDRSMPVVPIVLKHYREAGEFEGYTVFVRK